MQMWRHFLTVGDKNPIMFNDMLCECAWVESGLQLRGPSSNVCLPSFTVALIAHAQVHIDMCMLKFAELQLFCCFFTKWLHKRTRNFLQNWSDYMLFRNIKKYNFIWEYLGRHCQWKQLINPVRLMFAA